MHAWRKCAFLTLGAVLATSAVAKVSPQEAAKLGLEGTELTPFGAIRAGNADGSIPAWEGGIKTPPAGYKEGDWYVDPYADDKPLFTITAQNYEQYADKLSAGQVAMFKKYPATYKMHVYPSRRSASFPQWHYENSIYNATHTEWCNPSPGPNREKRCVAPGSFKAGVFFRAGRPARQRIVLWRADDPRTGFCARINATGRHPRYAADARRRRSARAAAGGCRSRKPTARPAGCRRRSPPK